jgi:hypothetical protein
MFIFISEIDLKKMSIEKGDPTDGFLEKLSGRT